MNYNIYSLTLLAKRSSKPSARFRTKANASAAHGRVYWPRAENANRQLATKYHDKQLDARPCRVQDYVSRMNMGLLPRAVHRLSQNVHPGFVVAQHRCNHVCKTVSRNC